MKHYDEKESGLALDEPSLGGMIVGVILVLGLIVLIGYFLIK